MSDTDTLTPTELSDALGSFLKENILAEGVDVTPQTELGSIGVDSFSLMEIILFVERRFGYLMPVEELTPENLATLESLSQRLYDLIKTN